jgi:NADP-dependent 3-hydroxy acid dehydrogenase YdfG
MPVSNSDEFKTDEWDRMVDVNIKGVLNATAAALPQMIKQHSGHIFNTSSIAGRKVFGPGFTGYSASRFAVKRHPHTLAGSDRKCHIFVGTGRSDDQRRALRYLGGS